ncbi:hypothetical protein [Paenibacillus thalictri]|uniref:hypothetical protein n=1 Tax=Paenibacillus thalictri TaxID=2527873 RepID=UPI0013EF4DC3|nr:hypothetical protein [Paenibacillus thalictri]
MDVSRYSYFGITLEVYGVAAFFLAVLAVIVVLAYRDAAIYRRNIREDAEKRLP